jgi:DNA-binding SARP family transcriptional activator
LLPDWDEEWILIEREIYRELRVHALEALATSLLSRGNHLDAKRACLYAIRCSPFRDPSHRLLAHVYIAEGNPSAALQHILSYRETVREELNLNPNKILSDLVEELQS